MIAPTLTIQDLNEILEVLPEGELHTELSVYRAELLAEEAEEWGEED